MNLSFFVDDVEEKNNHISTIKETSLKKEREIKDKIEMEIKEAKS